MEPNQDANKEEAFAQAKVEGEIPDDLKEFPPPTPLGALDKQMDALLEDVKILLDSRIDATQVSKFDNYKAFRKEALDGIVKVEMPARRTSFGEVVADELKSYWNVEEVLEKDKLSSLLISFFQQRSLRLINQNNILLARWARFAQTSFDMNQFYPIFKKQQSYLKAQYDDAAMRYERLLYHTQEKSQTQKDEDARLDAQRIEDERRGLAVIKPKHKKKEEPKVETQSEETDTDLPSFGAPEISKDVAFNIEDMTVYLRWMITNEKERRDIRMFQARAKTISHQDRSHILKHYGMLKNLKPGADLTECLEYYEGVNEFVSEPPLRVAKVEDFITEFDLLVAFWKVETNIDQEDGRPFAYEVDHKFFNNFIEQTMEANLAPYDALKAHVPEGGANVIEASGFGGTTGLESVASSLANLAGFSFKSALKNRAPRLRKADWVDKVRQMPIYNQWQEVYHNELNKLKETDMEVHLEHDLILSSDHEYVSNILKQVSKTTWEKASSVPNSRPLNVKTTILPQNREYKPNVELHDTRQAKVYDFGMTLPDGHEDISTNEILSAKKRDYGAIIKANEENRKIELEILSADPSRQISSENIVQTTLATLFSEHEVLAYLQLRYVKMREYRIKILRQFNFLRSIEKRLTRDGEEDDINDTLTKMMRHMEFMDLNMNAKAAEDAEVTENASTYSEDFRSVVNERIQIADSKGVPFVYDVALSDMSAFEKEMLRIITHYINLAFQGNHSSAEYLDELRLRTSNRRTELVDVTYLNAGADRSQMLLEFMDLHVKFMYSKIELINAYMESYEHCTDIPRSKEIAQVIVTLVHTKPILDLKDKYFSQSYRLSIKSMQLHARLIAESNTHFVTSNREWCKRYSPTDKITSLHFVKKNAKPEVVPESFFTSSLKSGLPFFNETEKTTVTLHHPSVPIYMTEVIPSLDNSLEIWKLFKETSAEICRSIEILQNDKVVQRSAVEVVTLKCLCSTWDSMADYNFQLSSRVKKAASNLDADVWFNNPFLPDALLGEFYVPFDQKDEGNHKSLGVRLHAHTYFDDPSYQVLGREILQRTIKAVLLRSRLLTSWMEGENWRKCYEEQLPQMRINPLTYTGRLNSLRYDAPHSSEEAPEDEVEDDNGNLGEDANHSIQEVSGLARDVNALKWGPLAIGELDENMGILDANNFLAVVNLLRPAGIERLQMSLKIQLIEKNWYMTASEMHSMLLSEIHGKILTETNFVLVAAEKKGSRPGTGTTKKEDPTHSTNLDVDYRNLILSNLTKKKQLRRLMLGAFSKEYRVIAKQDITENTKDQTLSKYRVKLIDWYFMNMSEVVMDDCDRTEFAKVMTELRHTVSQAPYGKLLFMLSPVTTNAQYFAMMSEGQGQPDKILRYKQTVQTQELVYSEGLGHDRLPKLWYIPHLAETLVMNPNLSKIPKAITDLSHRVYRNNQVFSRAVKVHSLLYELLILVTVFGHLLQDNRRYTPTVRLLREADYIVNTVNLVRRDLLSQGDQAEFSRVESYLATKWMIWYFKIKYSISLCIHALDMNMMQMDRKIVEDHYTRCIARKYRHLRNPNQHQFEQPFMVLKTRFAIVRTFIPTPYVFGSLSVQAKRMCDTKVTEIEESVEEFIQSVQYGGADQDVNKAMIQHLSQSLQLLALKREYARKLTGKPFTNETEAKLFFSKFKMKIVVPAIRAYTKQGAKGGASVVNLLQDDVITGNSNDFNRTARQAFDKCQLSVLHTELTRELTLKLVKEAAEYFEQLTDERLGRLFRGSHAVHVSSITEQEEFAFKITEEDYNKKSDIFNELLSDLYKANLDFVQELKDKMLMSAVTAAKPGKGKRHQVDDSAQVLSIVEDKRVYVCRKESLGKALVKMAIELSRWKEDRIPEQERFSASLYTHLVETVRNCEKVVLQQLQEKREFVSSFKREKRIAGFEMSAELHAELASLSVEVAEMRKNKRVDERKLRNKILDEYDELVEELIYEIGVLRHRFREYQSANFNDVCNIVTEAKKEQLLVMAANADLPKGLRDSAATLLAHEEQISSIRQLNYELKMAILKIRSMFTLKEQALKSSYEKKIRKLEQEGKEAEQKLWDSYRDAESRERSLRKQLTKIQKQKGVLEVQYELLQRRVEEENKAKQQGNLKALVDNPTGRKKTVNGKDRGDAQQAVNDVIKEQSQRAAGKVNALEDRLKRHQGINVENLINELATKTSLLEEFIQEKRDREKNGKRPASGSTRETPDSRGRSSKFRKSRSPSPTAKSDQTANWAARAAEPDSANPYAAANHSQLIDALNKLVNENKALRRKLFLNGVKLPPESRQVPYLSRPATSDSNEISSAPRSRPRTSLSSNGRRSAGILKNASTPDGRNSLPRIDADPKSSKSVGFTMAPPIIQSISPTPIDFDIPSVLRTDESESRPRPQTAPSSQLRRVSFH